MKDGAHKLKYGQERGSATFFFFNLNHPIFINGEYWGLQGPVVLFEISAEAVPFWIVQYLLMSEFWTCRIKLGAFWSFWFLLKSSELGRVWVRSDRASSSGCVRFVASKVVSDGLYHFRIGSVWLWRFFGSLVGLIRVRFKQWNYSKIGSEWDRVNLTFQKIRARLGSTQHQR